MSKQETQSACYNMLHDVFALKKDETIVITYDTESCEEVAVMTADAAEKLEAKPVLIRLPAAKGTGKAFDHEHPIELLSAALSYADVWIEFGAKFLYGGTAFDKATEANKKLRYFLLNGFDSARVCRMLGQPYMPTLAKFLDLVAEATKNAKTVRMTNPAGTDVSFDNVPGRFVLSANGIVHTPMIAMVPGQIAWMPDYKTLNGVIVVDGLANPGISDLDQPIKLTMEKGYIVKFEGGKAAKEWEDWMNAFGDPEVKRVAHASYGLHPNAIQGGNNSYDICEGERVWGATVWGFGEAPGMLIPDLMPAGLHAMAHTDGMCLNSSVYLDGVAFMEEGKVVGPTKEIADLARKLGK